MIDSTTIPPIPMAELVRHLSYEAQDLAIRGITTVLNRARYLEELRDAAKHASLAVERLEHDHEPFRSNADPCPRCKAEAREQTVLAALERQRVLLATGRSE